MAVKGVDESRQALRGIQEALREAEDRLEELNATPRSSRLGFCPDRRCRQREILRQRHVRGLGP